jgi:hypothetical protein
MAGALIFATLARDPSQASVGKRNSVAIAGAWKDLDGDGAHDIALVSRACPILTESKTPCSTRLEVISSRDGKLLQQRELIGDEFLPACITSTPAQAGGPQLLAFVAPDGVRILVDSEAPQSKFIPEASGLVAWIPDEDGDGLADLVVERANHSPALLTSRAWTLDVERYRSIQGLATTVGDVDADGVVDLVASRRRPEGTLSVVSGKSGKPILALGQAVSSLWSSEQDVLSGAEAQDADGDGRRDFYVASFDPIENGNPPGAVLLVAGRDGALLHEWRPSEGFDGGGASQLVLVDDQDGDGVRELFLTLGRPGGPGTLGGVTAFVLSGKSLAQLRSVEARFGGYPMHRALFVPARSASAPSDVVFATRDILGGGFVYALRTRATWAETWVVP